MFLGIFSRFFNTLLWPDPKPVYAFALVDSTADVHIPSDLEGISLATYTPHASGNIQAAVGPACARIKQSIRQLGLKANGSTLGDVPGDLFWLGHDLSLAIRNNMLGADDPTELEEELMLRSPAKIIKQCLFHLDKCGLREMAVCYSQASYARYRLLSVLKRVKAGHCLQQQDRLQIKCLIEEAKLAIGHKIEQMQDDFRQFPDPDISERYDREADPEDSA